MDGFLVHVMDGSLCVGTDDLKYSKTLCCISEENENFHDMGYKSRPYCTNLSCSIEHKEITCPKCKEIVEELTS